jgi:RimJ/RimL family protein N-acetyltransferase
MSVNHKGTKLIDSTDIILRPFTIEDTWQAYENWTSDPEATKYLTWKTHEDVNVTEGIVRSWIENYKDKDFYHWAIQLQGSGEVVGSV